MMTGCLQSPGLAKPGLVPSLSTVFIFIKYFVFSLFIYLYLISPATIKLINVPLKYFHLTARRERLQCWAVIAVLAGQLGRKHGPVGTWWCSGAVTQIFYIAAKHSQS